jgi:hypothetical protein
VVILTPRQAAGLAVRDVAIYLDQVQSVGGTRTSTAQAPRLLVTAVLRGAVNLQTDLIVREPAEGDTLVAEARARVRRYLDAVTRNTADLVAGEPLVDAAALERRAQRHEAIAAQRAEAARPPEGVSFDPPAAPPQPAVRDPRPERQQADRSPTRISFRADKIVVERNEEGTEGRVLVMGDIALMFPEPGTQRIVTLRAENAVIFLDPAALDDAEGRSLSIDHVRGVYLEGHVVVTDGDYTFRGQRVFYDVQEHKALVLDAVLYAWDPRRQVPLYVRAQHLRQHSRNQWSAQEARFTTSEFAEPHFAIGVGRVTITREPGGAATSSPSAAGGYHISAQDITLEASQVPFFYWPGISGDATDVPLRRLNAGYTDRRGAVIETQWDLFALLNRGNPQGVQASLLVDGFTERGPGIGIDADYDVASAFGELEAYYLFDQGKDEPGGRRRVDPETEHRGRAVWRHRHELPDDWEATLEGAWVSDPNFLEEFYPRDAMTDKEYESLVYLKQQRHDWAFTFLAKYDFMDFIAQTDLLQTRGSLADGAALPGYTTQKLPEVEYYRVATPLLDGLLTWYSENRGSVMRLNLPRDTPRERGFTTAESTALLGLAASTSFEQHLRDAGLDDDTRLRGDTRQEIQAPLEVGFLNVTPYAVGRVTAYGEDFEEYSGDDEQLRLWGAVGARVATSFSRVYPHVRSTLFDIHRLRHLVEPTAHVFYAETTMNQEDLPVYDYDVESLSEGGQVRLGLRNTLQTQRGGEGNWRSVDWIRIDNDLILNTGETERESPIAQFFDYRPEHSLVGDHVWNQVAWQVTEAVAAIGDVNYSLEDSEVSRWTAGLLIDHTPRLTSFVQYREIGALGVPGSDILRRAAYIRYGFDYVLTPKYHIGLAHSYDLERDRDRDLTIMITRRLPRWLLMITIDIDRIEETTSAGVALIPEGFAGRGSPGRNPFLFDRN